MSIIPVMLGPSQRFSHWILQKHFEVGFIIMKKLGHRAQKYPAQDPADGGHYNNTI